MSIKANGKFLERGATKNCQDFLAYTKKQLLYLENKQSNSFYIKLILKNS